LVSAWERFLFSGLEERSDEMFWNPRVINSPRPAGSDVYSALLLAAMRTFREVEAGVDADRTREGMAMAEFAEIVVPPAPGGR
jgi:hypothetical protein